MADPIAAMRAVADRLDPAGVDYAFVGGCIVNLLLDHLSPVSGLMFQVLRFPSSPTPVRRKPARKG